MQKLIDADRFEEELYHEAFERDTDMQRWDSGCWIRYKLFERTLEIQPAVDAVPVIRCKDCKLNPKRMWVGCPMAHCLDRTDEWYCPVGKPKEGEE